MSQTATLLPFVQPLEQWEAEGRLLGERQRSAHSLMWDIGDWWNRGEAYGERAQTVSAGGWTGPTHGTCREAGRVAARWDVSNRFDTLDFKHHAIVAALEDDQAIPLLRWAAEPDEDGKTQSTQQLKTRVQQIRRADREADLADKIERATGAIGHQLYGVVYADPPWRLEPYSRETGMNRAADNHYPTMTLEDICGLQVPAAADAVLFLWATVPMLCEALQVMSAWGFAYKSHCVWIKSRVGTGFWFRNAHELLLVGTRGELPAPAPGTQYASVIEAPLGEHSAKPAAFAEMIEELFPSLPAVELFARGPRLGWDVWGNEAESA